MSERQIFHVVFLPVLILAGSLASRVNASPPAAANTEERVPDDRLSLIDLPAYLAALSGRATNDAARPSEPPRKATFRDLWEHSSAYRGHRFRVEGRVERIFRQGPVGSFPPLAQVWIANSTGDLVCIVFPVDGGETHEPGIAAGRPASKVPEIGTTVAFTGTFLKQVRYTASDGDRLAPLVVGDQYPMRLAALSTSPAFPVSRLASGAPTAPMGAEPRLDGSDWLLGTRGQWSLVVLIGAMTVALLVRQQFRRPPLRRPRRQFANISGDDPPLEFVEQVPPAPEIKPGRNGSGPH